MTNWIIAPVVLPALLAPLIVLLMRDSLFWQRRVGIASTLALLGIALALMAAAASGGPQIYLLGNWPAPFGIVLVLDRLSALMLVLTAALAMGVLVYAVGTGWDARGKHFHALFLFQLMGLNGAFLTGDAFNLFVFFEVLLIASYGLMIHGGGSDRLRAGVQYVAYNLIASTLFLFALATIYAVTGTLNMADLSVRVAALPAGEAALIRVAGVLLMLVFAIKGALVPLHFWLPGAYAQAPGPVAALFAVMTKVGAYAVIRIFTLIFPPEVAATGTLFASLLLPAALITLMVGAVGVLGAASLFRLVAFAAIASMGTLFIAISQFTPGAMAAALYYLVHSTLVTAALFLIADLVLSRRKTAALAGPYQPMAQGGLIGCLFFGGVVGMAGMPPLSGFVGKLLIMDATRGPGMALIWGVILMSSLVMVVGFARAGSLLFWKTGAEAVTPNHSADPLAFAAVVAVFAMLLALTVGAGPVMEYMTATAAQLFDAAPYIAINDLPRGAVP
jgi:multicomponent K+:H+ antiporter subunit D